MATLIPKHNFASRKKKERKKIEDKIEMFANNKITDYCQKFTRSVINSKCNHSISFDFALRYL